MLFRSGNWLIFMDAYEHEAINLSKNRRIILVIDYLRPEFFERISKIISTVMTSLFLQRRAEKWQILKKFPFWFIKLITILLRPFALLEIKRVTYFNVY